LGVFSTTFELSKESSTTKNFILSKGHGKKQNASMSEMLTNFYNIVKTQRAKSRANCNA
jgi:hypothetical protein